MQKTQTHQTSRGQVIGFEAEMNSLGEWRPVVTQVRETILRGYVTGSHMLENVLPPAVMRLSPSQDEVEDICQSAHDAIRAGRLIDFGAWTNDTMKYASKRGGPLYSKGMIGHPFREPYVFMHSWDCGNERDPEVHAAAEASGIGETATSIYLVNPQEPDKPAGGDCECVELQPLQISGERLLMIADRIRLEPGRDGEAGDPNRYYCVSIPSVWRFLPGAEVINKQAPEHAAAANVLDPLMTALLILSTRGIPRETVAVSDKLQRARAKNGKPPIPPYDRVMSTAYVTAITNRIKRGRTEPKGGTHASPVAHLRMGHPRTYADGRKVWVRDAVVNMTEDAKRAWLAQRTHYTVKA